MVQIIPRETFAGNIAKGLAGGLAEQLPQEISRYRLKSGLQNLQKLATEGNLSPLELQAEAYTIPGMTPQMAQNIIPYIQTAIAQAQAKKQRQETALGEPSQPLDVEGMGTRGMPTLGPEETAPHPGRTFQEQQRKAPRLIGTPEALYNAALELNAKEPWRFPTMKEAEAEALNRFNTQEANIAAIDKAFDEKLSAFTHKDEKQTYGDVLGELQEKLKERAENDINSGRLTRSEGARKYAKEALEFAKNRINLMKKGNRLGWLMDNPDHRFKSIEATRQKYADLGQEEAFKNDLISTIGSSVPAANQMAFPVENHKSVYEAVKSFNPKKESIEEFAEKIKPKLNANDSIWSIALELEKHGGDAEKFVDAMDNLNRLDKTLNDRQEGELTERSSRPSLGDIYLSTGSKKQIGGKRNLLQKFAERHYKAGAKYGY